MLDATYSRGLFNAHGNDIETIDFKSMLRPIEQG
jgi:hypothetical protein